MKKYYSYYIFAVISWLILLFIYNYRSSVTDYGILIPTYMTLIALLNAYLFNFVIIPKFYFPKFYFKFIFFSLAAFILSAYLQLLFVFAIFVHIKFDVQSVTPRLQDVFIIISSTWLIIFASISIKQTYNVSLKAKMQEVLQKEKFEIELKMLKSQINPHFLFNTLNSIYFLAKKKSDKTPDMVLKLSDMLDYLLYGSSTSLIEINKEVEFINDYIELEKLRYGDKLDFNIEVNLNRPNYQIEPMLLIPLVENAFKHGVKHERKKALVDIQISDFNGLDFKIMNTIPSYKPDNEKGGIGLKNLKDRLEKLYSNGHKLTIEDKQDKFFVHLNLTIQ